ncbi:MAG: polysaccharide deacetylase family protein, partial [Chitinivibrionales bacterium]|nr:polysaccharide deacetylase family protein [Chitinivibrionales bacterium]
YSISIVALILIGIPFCAGLSVILIISAKKNNCHRPFCGIVFHQVSVRPRWGVSHYSAGAFGQVIETLQSKGQISCTVSQAATALKHHNSAAPPLFCISFDDGFQDFYNLVLPLLDKCRHKVTLFPIAGYIGKTAAWDVFPPQTHCTASQVRLIAESGHEIGSHSLTHPDLTMLENKDLKKELEESKKTIEDIIGKEVVSISFPYGKWNNRIWRTARECGYTCAASYGFSGQPGNGIFPMTGVYSFDSPEAIFEKAGDFSAFSPVYAQSRIMPHFAKGSTVWKFRSNYSFRNSTS